MSAAPSEDVRAFTAWAPARTKAGAGRSRPLVLRESVGALGSLASVPKSRM